MLFPAHDRDEKERKGTPISSTTMDFPFTERRHAFSEPDPLHRHHFPVWKGPSSDCTKSTISLWLSSPTPVNETRNEVSRDDLLAAARGFQLEYDETLSLASYAKKKKKILVDRELFIG
jgi:hypothetical protein